MENEPEIIWNLSVLDFIWRGKPTSLQFGWILLIISLIIIIISGILLFKKNKYFSFSSLIGKLFALSSAIFCAWGVSRDVINSGNSIDTPQLKILEQMAVAKTHAFISASVFTLGFALIFMALYIFNYLEKKNKKQKDIALPSE